MDFAMNWLLYLASFSAANNANYANRGVKECFDAPVRVICVIRGSEFRGGSAVLLHCHYHCGL